METLLASDSSSKSSSGNLRKTEGIVQKAVNLPLSKLWLGLRWVEMSTFLFRWLWSLNADQAPVFASPPIGFVVCTPPAVSGQKKNEVKFDNSLSRETNLFHVGPERADFFGNERCDFSQPLLFFFLCSGGGGSFVLEMLQYHPPTLRTACSFFVNFLRTFQQLRQREKDVTFRAEFFFHLRSCAKSAASQTISSNR